MPVQTKTVPPCERNKTGANVYALAHGVGVTKMWQNFSSLHGNCRAVGKGRTQGTGSEARAAACCQGAWAEDKADRGRGKAWQGEARDGGSEGKGHGHRRRGSLEGEGQR